MKLLGYVAVMTSTNSDEQAQHFYRKLGYKDCGCLILDIPRMEQPTFTNGFGSDTFPKDTEECQEIAEKILSSVL